MPPPDTRVHDGDEEQDSDDTLTHLPLMCSICHSEPPINAVQINCGHIFCFLCIKSVSETTGCCALCRTEIGVEFNFKDHQILGLAQVPFPDSQNKFWFYEGFRGWWLYDAETNREISEACSNNQTHIERFISGSMYVIDIENMNQYRKDGEGRTRKICHATLELNNILGMAGLKGQDFDEILEMMRTHDGNQMTSV